ncbi:hypothetical protein GQ457_09G001010 [Hibiscus cannabinus]
MSSLSFAAPLALYQHTRISSKPILHKPALHKIHGGITCIRINFHLPHLKQSPVPVTYPSLQRGLSTLVPLDAMNKGSNSGSGEEDSVGALETVLKLYSAIKNKDVCGLSDIIDDECQCICNFFSYFQPLQGKKQVIEFFTSLINNLGNHIEFIVEPTLHEGMVVGIHWRLGLPFFINIEFNDPLRVEQSSCASGKRFQLLYLPCLPWKSDDKERRDVHGTTPSYGTVQAKNNRIPDDRYRQDKRRCIIQSLEKEGHNCSSCSVVYSYHSSFLNVLDCFLLFSFDYSAKRTSIDDVTLQTM